MKNKDNLKITFIGLGKMGSVLAKRLIMAHFDVTVYNRTQSKMQPLVQLGAKEARSETEAVKNADIVVTCLFDDASVLEMVDGNEGFLTALKPDAIHIGTTTILPATSKKLAELHQNKKTVYIAGNVLGVPKVAEQGELTSIVAGNENAIKTCMPIFNSYSKKVLIAGKEAYQANVLKICANYLLVSAIECMGEIYTFAEKSGLDTQMAHDLFDSVFAHPAFKLYIEKTRARTFDDVNFALSGGFKDLQLFERAFAAEGVVPAIGDVIKNKFIIALANGMENKDWSAITEVTRKLAGLE